MIHWRHILVWEVSTIAIPGQKLLERCEWNCGDVQLTQQTMIPVQIRFSISCVLSVPDERPNPTLAAVPFLIH